MERLVGDVTRRFGRLDILVNDAAYNKSIPFTDLDNLTLEVWDKIMAVNLTGPMRLIKAVAPVMKAQGRGRIVNIASVAGLGPTGSSIAYAVSKAGLIHLTRCMAVALAPETLVNCVAPGLLEGTRATANLRPEQIERSAAGIAAEEGRRQGRLRRHGGHHVPHRDHDRPDDRHRLRPLLSLSDDPHDEMPSRFTSARGGAMAYVGICGDHLACASSGSSRKPHASGSRPRQPDFHDRDVFLALRVQRIEMPRIERDQSQTALFRSAIIARMAGARRFRHQPGM